MPHMSGKLADWLSNQRDCWSRVVILSEWEGSSLTALPAPAFLLRQDAHQGATSHTAAQGMATCRKSGATWWERMGEELLRECGGTGGASLQSKCQRVTPTPLPALAITHQACVKYLHFPSNYSWISKLLPSFGDKIEILPLPTISNKNSLQWHMKVKQSLLNSALDHCPKRITVGFKGIQKEYQIKLGVIVLFPCFKRHVVGCCEVSSWFSEGWVGTLSTTLTWIIAKHTLQN